MSTRQTKTKAPPRHNKIYRCPPTPNQEDLLEKEKAFVTDSVAVSSISSDYSKANPKLGPVIPPYNSQHDRHVDNYFNFLQVNKTLKKTGQRVISKDPSKHKPLGDSIEGPVMEYFHYKGAGFKYLTPRNTAGAGHSREEIDGHSQFMQGVKPMNGYNGKFGYRRNTPWLRREPSSFGTASTSSSH